MHGVKRSRIPPVPDSEEVARKKREKELKRIEEYRALLKDVQDRAASHDCSDEALEATTRLLSLNPEFQTGWGIRRQILLDGPLKDADAPTRQQVLEGDLQLTNSSLKLNPKNYSVWEHRKWVLETMPDADWGMEIKMVEMYLEKDGRNFHSWDYRRYLISSILDLASSATPTPRTKPLPAPTTESELAFTTRKISANFSNFSAWHYRTKLLAKLWEEKEWGPEAKERVDRVEQEFELVKQAVWSDPNDQSAWLYHRWLVGDGTVPIVRREIACIEELLEEEPDSRWCLDSLVYYKGLLVRLLESEGEATRQERDELNVACAEMLDKLKEVDPMRRARYEDLRLRIIPARR
ncbi:Rab geranylgeranyltransferase BET4 [Rhodotorula paludigena]|uniref:Rab geranylgeranyltransferase BET4 n=1 Tax=Rhodotorula paludigena TaxID=86838 RepID=UPI0031803189